METKKRLKLFIFLYFFICTFSVSFPLSIDNSLSGKDNFVVIDKLGNGKPGVLEKEHHVNQRDIKAPVSNITSKVSHLNDSHQQIIVHWAGANSNVIVCLARSYTPVLNGKPPTPTAVYISYDYGATFTNQTHFFTLDTPDTYASIDKFVIHQKQIQFIVFIEKYNRVLYTSQNLGKTIKKVKLDFQLTDVLFYPEDPYVFLAYDVNRTLWVTRDFGNSFSMVQELVKTYYWAERWPGTWADTPTRSLLVQRIEPKGSTLLSLGNVVHSDQPNMTVRMHNIEQFKLLNDFMFVTKRLSPTNNELYISYRGSDFVKGTFDSELENGNFHVADAGEIRLMVAVAHTETLSNLYISEVTSSGSPYMFRLSLERLFTYFPNTMWKESWLSDVADETFADIHKVQGVKGIYLASQVQAGAKSENLNPEHLRTLVTFDWGGEWKPITPPTEDEFGKPISCNASTNCSLHLTQKFMYLYPFTRNLPIVSSASAPGLIIATGVLGSSLKGHPGVFVSRDAGLSWHKVLQENYHFNFGDHGGVMTAVRYFKSSGETNELLYSTDEGITWHSYLFYPKKVRIYGLMTEPGGNTTVFTIFGSEVTQHEWIIINIDLKNAFAYNCNPDDYKMWSPSTGAANRKMSCVMGQRVVYERRIPHSNCYNGKDYQRQFSKETCECDIEDFECDFGFLRHVASPGCIRNKSETIDPYSIPPTCKPEQFYNRTKGYRKISGDLCTGGYEEQYLPEKLPCPFNETNQFLLVAQKNKVLRFDLTDPSKPEILPISGLGNVIAIDFDMKNNCVFYADIKKDLIGRQCLTSGKELPELLVMNDLSSIEGLAYDWISKYLYFVDGQRAKIEMIWTDINHSGRMRKTILNDTVLDKPRGIALHPKLGYLFYTDWSHENPSVSRANLDGSNVKRLFTKPNVMWPNGITVDHIAETIYWVDAKLDYIASSDLHGRGFRKTLVHDERLVHPFSVAVFKDFMYWDDWFLNTIVMADKDHGAGIRIFAFNYTGLMDLKVYAHSLQEGTNRCQNGTAGVCSHLCFAQPDNNPPVCACPDAMIFSKGECLCADGTKPNANNTCPKIKQKCLDVQFSCHNNLCIPLTWKCDGMNDCGDSSDELFCHAEHCTGNSFRCNDGQCIPKYWVCDRDPDCRDKSDELNCPNVACANNQFQCSDKRCISARWRCDGENDCRDGSDERNCTNREPVTCNDKQFSCPGNTCIPNSWVCDGENDCLQGEDEKNCTVRKCESYQFKCEKSKRCIYSSWRCDGDADCGEGDTSDEENCNITSTVIPTPVQPFFNVCKGFMFECKNKKCVPSWWKCDGVDDCSDNSDEEGCPSTSTTPQTPLPPSHLPPTSVSCKQNEFMCKTGECVRSAWLCDGERDCPGGEDETNCDKRSCPTGYIKCQFAPTCILAAHECDGVVQCPDGSDEIGCLPAEPEPVPVNPICSEGFFSCDGSKCLPLAKFCDDHRDCYDEYDETNCNDHPDRVYQVLQISVDKRRKNATAIPIQWWIQTPAGVKFEFLPSRAEIADGKQMWKNQTKWTSNIDSVLADLYPATQYNITVFVRIAGRARAYPPAVFVTATTGEAPPSPPWNVTVVQKSLEEVKVSWNSPRHPNGVLTGYTIYSSPPLPPSSANAPPSKTSFLFPGRFIQGSRYSFWVVAVNQAGESNSSDVKTVVSESDAGVGPLLLLKGLEVGESSVLLAWEPVPGAEGYKVVPATQPPYPALNTVKVNTSKCSVKNLAPGVQYKFSVNAYSKSYEGPKSTISIKTKGEELPKVEGLEVQLLKDFATSVKLSWQAPKSAKNLKWKYQVYYGTTAEQLYRNGKTETSNTSATVHGLEACQKYLFDVGLSGPLGHGPLTGLSTMEITRYSPKAPVKQLRLSMDPHNETLLLIRWSSSCPQMSQPIGYIIHLEELGTLNQVVGKKASVTLLPTNKTDLEHRVFVHYGAKYRVEVETTAEGAVSSVAEEHWAPTLPTPHQIQVQAHPHNSSFQIFWQLSSDLPNMPSVDYEVLVNEGMVLNVSSAVVIRSKSSPVWVGEMKEGTPYTMAVRLVSEHGFASPLSEITSVLLPVGSAMAVVSTSSLLSVVVPACALLLALLVGLSVYAVKHYRLRNSFSSFANSHYSTSSGAAVFTDRLDDEDSPVIRGFSDDEPLVVA